MVYWVLTCSLLELAGAILKTNDMGLIFHKKKKKMEKGIKEETGRNCNNIEEYCNFLTMQTDALIGQLIKYQQKC